MLFRSFQRESADVEVDIEGPLEASGGAAPPPAPPVSVALTGAWHGTVAWLATRRGSPGDTVVLGSALEAIAFSIASDGAFSGSGFGCTFAGHLTLASEGRAVSGGEITASRCANAAFNGSYASPSLRRDDDQLEVELEREESTASGVVKVKIAGKVMR